MVDRSRDALLASLATLWPRRRLWRFVAGALGLAGIARPPGPDGTLAKKKKGKKKGKKKKKPPASCTPKCAGKTCGPDGCGKGGLCPPGCGPGFDCEDGACQCPSAVICDGTCCGDAGDVCDTAGACCAPEAPETTCIGKCGLVDNTCDEQIPCGDCEPRTCQTAICTAQNLCDYDDSPDNQPGEQCEEPDEFCCHGHCCSDDQVCFDNDCCTPDTENQTCAGKCGLVNNTCGEEIDCGGCGPGFICSSPNDGICECANGGVECDGVCCEVGDICALATDTCSPAYTFVTKWGTQGSSDGQFFAPGGIALDVDGKLYVADAGNERVQKFDSDGTFLAKWGSFGTSDGAFDKPRGVEVDANGVVYVADQLNHRVQLFTDAAGPDVYEFLDTIGAAGDGDGQFSGPTDIALDGAGNIYVTDQGHDRIQTFDSTRAFDHVWGGEGSGEGQLNAPIGIAVAGAFVYVTDVLNNRIQKFGTDGTFEDTWGTGGAGNAQFNGPLGIAVDAEGAVYVADTDNSRIQKFDSDGMFITKWGSLGAGDGQFNDPWGIAVDGAGNVYVADNGNHRIQVFAPTPVAPLLRAGGRLGVERRERARHRKRDQGRNQDRSRGKRSDRKRKGQKG